MYQRRIQTDATGFTQFHETDEGFAIQEYEDLSGHVELCKREAIETQYGGRIKGPEHGVHVASIPVSKLIEWASQNGIDRKTALRDDKVIDRFLAAHPVFDLTQGRAQRYFNGT